MFGVASRGNLLVYPEGHRMGSSDTPAPLKKGMIAVTDLQFIPISTRTVANMTCRSFSVLEERRYCMRKSCTVVGGI